MSKINLTNQTAPATPSAGTTEIYVDQADKHLKIKDDAGLVSDLLATATAITALTGEVTASGPGSAAATVSNSAVLSKVLTGFTNIVGTVTATDTILQAIGKLSTHENRGEYGNGSDGDVVISTNTTLTRDMYYNNLEIQGGATLFPAGFRIHVLGAMTGSGTIDRTGTDATGTAATAALAAGTTGGSGAGGAGGTAAGSAGGAGSIGGAGGTGGATGSAGGTAGVATVPTPALGGVECLNAWRQAAVARDLGNTVLVSGAGGGGGAGDGTAGGAGGSGGGVVVLAAKEIAFTGLVTVQGGGGFQPTAGNRGGGAGGGGGVIIVISGQDLTTLPFTTNVSGGTGASGFGTGGSGGTGANGRLIKVRV